MVAKHLTLLLFIGLAFWGCSPVITYVPEKSEVSAIDFTPFTKKDFLFTPNKYLGEYESVGIIYFKYHPEAKLVKKEIERSKDERDNITKTVWEVAEYNPNLLLYDVYTACVSMGADALTEFTFEGIQSDYGFGSAQPISIDGISIKGFAIKRK